jgi:hypothetical protein
MACSSTLVAPRMACSTCMDAWMDDGCMHAWMACSSTLAAAASPADATSPLLLPPAPHRFYFLSNDELLEILAQARQPRAVQPHLAKCFDGIRSLDLGGDSGCEVLAMCSAEGERVPLARPFKARGAVESWLCAVEAGMRASLKAAAKKAVREYPGSGGRERWALQVG